jgi:uncharacterized protein YbbC (DUF1343 family)
VPTFSKFSGQPCAGVQAHIVDRDSFRAVSVGVALLSSLQALWPDRFAWRESSGRFFIDRLAGTARLRQAIDAGVPTSDLEREWDPGLRAYALQAQSARLYGE